MEPKEDGFRQWAVLEIMGHQTFAGLLSEEVIAGHSFVRIDVPDPDGDFTKLFGASSIYCITPTSEEFARAVAARRESKPVNLYMPELYPQEDDDDYDRHTVGMQFE